MAKVLQFPGTTPAPESEQAPQEQKQERIAPVLPFKKPTDTTDPPTVDGIRGRVLPFRREAPQLPASVTVPERPAGKVLQFPKQSGGEAPTRGGSKALGFAKDLAAARIRNAVTKRLVSKKNIPLDEPLEPNYRRWRLAKVYVLVAEGSDWVEDLIEFILAIIGIPAGEVPPLIGWLIEILVDLIVFDIPIAVIANDPSLAHNSAFAETTIHRIDAYARQIISIRTTYARALKGLRRIGPLRQPISRLALRFSAIRDQAQKSIVARLWKAFGIDLIPFVDFLPVRYFAVQEAEKLAIEAYEIAVEAKKQLQLASEEAAALQRFAQEHGIEAANRELEALAEERAA